MNRLRIMSGIEIVANLILGFALAVLVQLLALPAVGLTASLRRSVDLGAIFAAVSRARGTPLRPVLKADRAGCGSGMAANDAGAQQPLGSAAFWRRAGCSRRRPVMSRSRLG